jgi:hypothetical protein
MNEVKYIIMINYDCQISKDELNSIEEELYDKGFDQKLAQGSYLFNADIAL